MSRPALLLLALLLSSAWPGAPAHAGDDDYAAMLGYLANARIDGNAFGAANGAIAVNMAAGDLNQQANLRALASGGSVVIQSRQSQRGNLVDRPLEASVSIGGQAFAAGNGLASINQASGSGNAQLNAVAAVLTAQGIRETTDDSLSTVVSASAGGQHPGTGTSDDGTHNVAVEASAMRGYQGVMQLNQAAGSGNATGNQLLLSVPPTPR